MTTEDRKIEILQSGFERGWSDANKVLAVGGIYGSTDYMRHNGGDMPSRDILPLDKVDRAMWLHAYASGMNDRASQ
jgi:hypothetical protein